MTSTEILENAPTNATHVDDTGVYYRYYSESNEWFKYHSPTSGIVITYTTSMGNLRSLEDVKTILMYRNRINQALEYLDSDEFDTSYNACCALNGE